MARFTQTVDIWNHSPEAVAPLHPGKSGHRKQNHRDSEDADTKPERRQTDTCAYCLPQCSIAGSQSAWGGAPGHLHGTAYEEGERQ